MKVFDLVCPLGHRFEGWFSSEESYKQQVDRSLLVCPICGNADVSKGISAPRIQRKSNQHSVPTVDITKNKGSSLAQPISVDKKQVQSMQLSLQSVIIDEIIKNTEDVGERFAEEARKIHYDEAPTRGIRGQATEQEAKELQEEGIEVVPLPAITAVKKH